MAHLNEKLIKKLTQKLQDDKLTHSQRLNIGIELAQIGDTRTGVGIDSNNLPDIKYCKVNSRLYISKYHVTVIQMKAFFMDDEGYNNDEWWNDLALTSKRWHQDEEYHNYPAQNINWYTAVAFTKWLSKKTNSIIRLPTESEWLEAIGNSEIVNQYTNTSLQWNNLLANTRESQLTRPISVGLYPKDKSKLGMMDIIGNVGEWCLNESICASAIDYSSGKWKRAIGGSFMDNTQSHQIIKHSFSPINTFTFVGFRVIKEVS